MSDQIDFKKFTATRTTWEFKIKDFEFSCDELNLGEEVDFFNYYIDPDGRHNIAKLRMTQCIKLNKTPFTSEWIKYVFNEYYPEIKISDDISWKELSLNHRLMFLSKIDKDFMTEIMNEVGKHYTEKEEIVKN
jgi:hypothetical protein